MLEDQVAYLLQRYLGNYVKGLNKEALKISVWKGDVELKNMQLKPEALNSLNLPVKVKAGFLGSVRLKVPWSRLGQDPVLVYLDRIFILAEPATQVEGCSEDAVQEAKKSRVREMEMRLLENRQQLQSTVNKSWLGSLINTIIGNLKLSITNIHIRYEDHESNPGHPFASGVTLAKLSAVTIDDSGKETFVTGGALERIQKLAELERLALYLDSDICPWHIDKPWEDLLPSEWSQVFEFGTKSGKSAGSLMEEHTYILQPVTGHAKYSKLPPDKSTSADQPLQKATIILDDVTLCLSKNGYRDILKLADNFAAFNKRLQYAHYRPPVPVKSDPRSWWKYACKAVSDQMKKASGKLSWEHVLKYARLRKRYISLYASLLKSDPSRMVVDDNKEIEELDRGLDIEVILQWRMLAHKFMEQSIESDINIRKQKAKKSWWSFGWSGQSMKDENEPWHFSEEDRERLNKVIGYKEDDSEQLLTTQDRGNILHTCLEVHMNRNASKLITEARECLAELSCQGLDCTVKLYSEAKIFDLRLGSYLLSSPNGLLAESATMNNSLVGIFSYKPFDANVDWSLVAKASPCYMTYLKDSIDQVITFFESSTAVSQTLAVETAAAVQMTIDGVKRTAQQQVNRALKDQMRFLLDLDIAAPKITIPTFFCPDNYHATKLLLDLGNLMLSTQDDSQLDSSEEMDMYLQFNLCLSDVSAFLVDGDYHWGQNPMHTSSSSEKSNDFSVLPVIDKCGIVLKLQQIWSQNPSLPSTRLAVRLPSLGFHFSPACYHRLMQIAKIFQSEENVNSDFLHPWNQADFEGWLSQLVWKGVGNREAVWQRRYFCLVGPFLYVLESPGSKTYKQCISLRGKQIYQIPAELVGNVQHVLAICDAGQSNNRVVEDINALVLRFDSDDSRRTWLRRLQGAIYRASGSVPITDLSETSSECEDAETEVVEDSNALDLLKMESVFITGVLDELKICFSYSHQGNGSFMKVLLAEETHLLEFRAIGGQVELLIKGNDMLVGTVLKSLEVEDLVYNGGTQPCYLARSFIKSTDITSLDSLLSADDLTQSENFFEASDNLVELVDCPEKPLPFKKLSIKPPSFSRIAGLLPDAEPRTVPGDMEVTDDLDSFVKAQIVIYDQNSPLYTNVDKQVMVTLAALSFFCRRPTILAVMEFVNAINIEDGTSDAVTNKSSSTKIEQNNLSDALMEDQHSATMQEPIIKGLLGKGKSRVIFDLSLSMALAQISLMIENGSKISTLSQNDLRTNIKVFPSSFSIKAALGNLKISDDSLPEAHPYFWVCDMRNPGGSSFVELVFISFNVDDDDYRGYDYSLCGQLSEVRIVYLNRFVQEVVSYFMGLVPNNSKGFVKLKDHVTNSEKWFSKSEIEGSPAVKLDLSLRKPIIMMPRRTDSLDYLELDVVHITVQNNFHWLFGDKNEMVAVHLEILTVQVENFNLIVGSGKESGESIIQDFKGLSVIIQRSLRDLLHQIPNTEVTLKIDELKAALSNKEYQIITECAISNLSETPNTVPPLDQYLETDEVAEPLVPVASSVEFEMHGRESWVLVKVSVTINLVELCLHSGVSRDSSLATVQASGAWLLYKSNTLGEGFLSATLKGFTVIDDREGTEEEFRLAIGKPKSIGYNPLHYVTADGNEQLVYADKNVLKEHIVNPVPTMLILDAKFSLSATAVSLCIQRPQLLVALDFLLAVAEFFVPTVRSVISNQEDENPLSMVDAIILDQPIYNQPSSDFSLSPRRPLVVDDERFDHFIYDGKGGNLYLWNSRGLNLLSPSTEAIIYVGNGKRLQFKNVYIKNGQYLDSCIVLGANSSYSASEDDHVFLESLNDGTPCNSSEERTNSVATKNIAADSSTELTIELQAIGPELTFYNKSKDVGELSTLSNKLLHAQLDAFSRLVLKQDNVDMSANAIGVTVESNGIRILEPFDTSIKFSNVSGKTNVHLAVSDIFMNFSFSILRLFLAVEEDILAFLRMTSKKVAMSCSQFDKVGTIENPYSKQTYTFWRPCAPPGFAVLGDYLTPMDKPPTKGVIAVNINFVRVKKPVSFKLIWPMSASGSQKYFQSSDDGGQDTGCSIWFPVAPQGYVALGCVVSTGRMQPPPSSVMCISASLVSPCAMRDCITVCSPEAYRSSLALWRVDNSIGSFLPDDSISNSLTVRAYDLRHMILGYIEGSPKESRSSNIQDTHVGDDRSLQPEISTIVSSDNQFEAVATFRLIWWNQGSSSRKKISIWHPVVLQGMVFFGDIAVQGYEPPNSTIVLHDARDDLCKAPIDFQLVGQIKKQRGIENISFWFPQAPPGFVSLGCIACKGTPEQNDISSLRCIRSDMVTGDQFPEESIWDTSDAGITTEPFSIWTVGNVVGTFMVRSGFKKPPRRFALKLSDPTISSGSDDTVIGSEIGTFSAALFDDYAGLMVPLFNVSLSGIGFNLHGRSDYLNSTVNFSVVARSYNDNYDSWEPLVEPSDGSVRYQYDLNAPIVSQLRVTSTRDLNMNVSVPNANMIFQAYASWSNLTHAHESYKKREAVPPICDGKSIIDIHQEKQYFIIPQNKLGQDIFMRATEVSGLPNIIRLPSGDMKPIKVPVSKNMLDAHLNGELANKLRMMVMIIIADGQLPSVEGFSAHEYTVTVRLVPNKFLPSGSLLSQQSARTCGCSSDHCSTPGLEWVNWSETFFFKVDSLVMAKRDIGWQFCTRIDPKDRTKTKCNFCGIEHHGGGVTRQKYHMAGNNPNVAKCTKCPIELSRIMAREIQVAAMKGKKKQEDEERLVQNLMEQDPVGLGHIEDYEGSDMDEEDEIRKAMKMSRHEQRAREWNEDQLRRTRSTREGRSGGGSSTASTAAGKSGAVMQMFERFKGKGKGKKRSTSSSGPDIHDLRSHDPYPPADAGQMRIEESLQPQAKEKMHKSIARWFHSAFIPAHKAKDPYFKAMVREIQQCGPNIPPPTPYQIAGPYLDDIMQEVNEYVEQFKWKWPTYGVSIMCDGWTGPTRLSIINFLIYCDGRTVFHKSVNTSDRVKDSIYLLQLMEEVVEEVGPENVVQIVTDNAANFKKAGLDLMAKRPHIFWTPCAAHCIDLMFKDIGEMPKVKQTVDEARLITNFIYNHSWVLSLMRKHTGGDIVRPAMTRFATNYVAFDSLLNRKHGLIQMTASEDWMTSSYAKLETGRRMQDLIFNQRFWSRMEMLHQVMRPLFILLKEVDGDKEPTMGILVQAMKLVREKIQEVNPSGMKLFEKIIRQRWEGMLLGDIHLAAHYLNPDLQYTQYGLAYDEHYVEAVKRVINVMEPDDMRATLAMDEDYYEVEFIVTDMGKDEPVGCHSAPLAQIARNLQDSSNSFDSVGDLSWIELSLAETMSKAQGDKYKFHGRIRCGVLLSPRPQAENNEQTSTSGRKPGSIQISPSREGPWTTVRLNYAASAACWRLGNAVVASEVNVKDGNIYVIIRSLVSVSNNTDIVLDLCLKAKAICTSVSPINDGVKHEDKAFQGDRFEIDEFFETEKYNPAIGWVGCSIQPKQDHIGAEDSHETSWSVGGGPLLLWTCGIWCCSFTYILIFEQKQPLWKPEISRVELPSGWEWVDDWHVDNATVNIADGWVYAPDLEHLKWPESYNHLKYVNYARQRRWIRNRKSVSNYVMQQISVGLLKPGDQIPLPLSCVTHPGLYALQLRPWNINDPDEYSWSSVVDKHDRSEASGPLEICVSTLVESEKLLCCTQIKNSSSTSGSGLWFCLSIQATEIGKDTHSDSIQDWKIVIKSPLSVINFLPLPAEFSVLEGQESGQFIHCAQGVLLPGETTKIYNADLRNPLYFSLLPQRGWQPMHEAVLISHASKVPCKTISLRSSFSGRIVDVILDQNPDKEQHIVAKVFRVYAPYWISSARCPPLTFRLVDISGKRQKRNLSLPFPSQQNNEVILEEITEEEMFEGYAINSALNFKLVGLSVAISQSGKEQFGPVRDLSPLGDLDGSIDLSAYDTDGNCIRLFISSKPCPYQSIPTKVISVRPFMTFTNRLGQNMFVKLSSEDEPKILRASDSRVSFVYRETGAADKLQVRLEDTEWCLPVEIVKEDTFYLVLRKHNGARGFVRTEIRGYEEGSRFVVVFRLGSTNGLIRMENRTVSKTIKIRQSGFDDNAWIQLEPLSTTNFFWEDPYGEKQIDAEIKSGNNTSVQKFSLDTSGVYSADETAIGVQLHIVEMGVIKVARFTDDRSSETNSREQNEVLASIGNWGISCMQRNKQINTAPVELIIEMGVFGISVIDHRPRELAYLYLERVFISFSTGYDGGTTSRFKLIFGYLQLDNQLPLTVMPVLLAPEQTTDVQHPVFKMTITMKNGNTDGTQEYPYIYIRVTEKCWRISIHEPIIWALVDFYNNLQIDRIPKSSNISEVDPEIRVDLIDVSEVRLKLSLETEPTQRPHGVLGIWSPILSAVGNAFKIQVHLRKRIRKNIFMRRSSVVPAILNRVWRDLIHNPLHLIFSVDVLGMTSSTLASLSKGFAELSTDGQFLQLRSKQVWSRRITGVSDGILQGTEALAQGVAFGVTGIVMKPVESARQHGLLGLVHGLGRACLGFIVQPVSGALDFFSLTVDGVSASCARCLEVFNSRTSFQRIRNPRAIHADCIIREYCEREALGQRYGNMEKTKLFEAPTEQEVPLVSKKGGWVVRFFNSINRTFLHLQMILWLAEASTQFSCMEIFKEPSKYAWSDYYEDHFIVPYQRIVLVTNKRVMLLQCLAPDKMDKKPCKIMWDVPWEELLALELAKAGYPIPSYLILHLKSFKRFENFVRIVKCNAEGEAEGEPQAVRICSIVHRVWKKYQSDMRSLVLKVPSGQQHVYFAWDESDRRDSNSQIKSMIKPREFSSVSSVSDERKFIKHSINFQKIWSSERESRSRRTLCRKQVLKDGGICSIWRPICPNGYVSIGDITRMGTHPPNVATVYHKIHDQFSVPVGYDLVWRNCAEDYATPVSIWYPRAPEGFISLGCVAVADFSEPPPGSAYCVRGTLAEETVFEEQKLWEAPDSYPWACHIYQVQSEALHFAALRQPKEETDWKPMRVIEDHQSSQASSSC